MTTMAMIESDQLSTASHAPPGPPTEPFFTAVQSSPQRLLLLDFDGTLAPFHPIRHHTRMYPGIAAVLDAMLQVAHSRIIIISGRSVTDLLPLLTLSRIPEIWGSHGGERRFPDGQMVHPLLDQQSQAALIEIHAWARNKGWAGQIDQKPAGIAFHWRGLPCAEQAAMASAILATWQRLLAPTRLTLHAFDGGLEIRPRDHHKGQAVQQILAELQAPAFVTYLGDDLTDEDAFRAIQGSGHSILVRDSYRPTVARFWLRPPTQLHYFFDAWHRAAAR
ncbi:MAG TPA: trehalose-phosphatase [Herpetosiphonaceae bacterium]